MKAFRDIYPFATENVGAYFERLDMKDKTVLTVGSSLDQAFNAMVLGAKKITVLDISPNTYDFFKLKKNIILTNNRKDIYKIMSNEKNLSSYLDILSLDSITLTKDILSEDCVYLINNYLLNDENYEILRNSLSYVDIEFITGDIFNMKDYLKNRKFDVIVLSNILQYMEYFFKGEDLFAVLKRAFPMWDRHLNKKGILQLLYLYSFSYDDIFKKHSIAMYNLKEVKKALKDYKLDIEWVDGVDAKNEDAIVTYQKVK